MNIVEMAVLNVFGYEKGLGALGVQIELKCINQIRQIVCAIKLVVLSTDFCSSKSANCSKK